MSKKNDEASMDLDDKDDEFPDTSASEASDNEEEGDEEIDAEEEEGEEDNDEDFEDIDSDEEEDDDEDGDSDEDMEEDKDKTNGDNKSKETTNETNKKEKKPRKVYLPGTPLDKGESLVYDPTAYVMLHEAQTGAPCLSFDIIKDGLGDERTAYPQTLYAVAGTQSKKFNYNRLIVMKMSNLTSTEEDNERELEDNESEEGSGDEDRRKDPVMNSYFIRHRGCVNRVRTCQYGSTSLAAVWGEVGKVAIWDLKTALETVDDPFQLAEHNKRRGKGPGIPAPPLYTFTGHLTEGFAMDWSPVEPGVLATGDCKRNIHIWSPKEPGCWDVDQKPLVGHTNSVEDLQWSPSEKKVLASCSVDRSIRIWDTRIINTKSCVITLPNAHTSDVNVISWNRAEPRQLVSGGDDGCLHVWDLKYIKEGVSMATFKHHTAPITTVEWHPTESSVFASGGADDQIALWDLATERESEMETNEAELKDLPPQLLFMHLGQKEIKELHWHPQLPGTIISTANSGFNIFRTISA